MNNRRRFLKRIGLAFLTLPAIKIPAFQKNKHKEKNQVYFTTGYKVSEVTDRQAIFWTRLCSQQFPNPIVHERREKVFRHPINFDEDMSVKNMDGGVSVSEGRVRIKLIGENGEKLQSEWMEATIEQDGVVSYTFDGLKADTLYKVKIEGKLSENSISTYTYGTFKTAPPPDQSRDLILTTSTCQYFWSFDDIDRGFKTYDSMRRMNPDLYIQTGDYIYYDKPGPLAKNMEQARHKWHAMDSRPAIRDLYAKTPVFMMKDDHDLLKNDVYPGSGNYGELSFADGLKLWYRNAPIRRKPYRKIRWGKDLEIWLVEGREYRSPNNIEDSPEKSIWGEKQKDWFTNTVEQSDATFKLLFTATPVVGPDRENKSDNHANPTFANEGKWLRKYLSNQNNMYVINGDRHWQYVSRDAETGLMEFGAGPISDYHAQGWEEGDQRPEHEYLALKGGFLSVKISRNTRGPYIVFTHHDVDGRILNRLEFSQN